MKQDSVTERPWETYSESRRRVLLAILFLVSLSNYIDRHIVSILIEPIKHEFGASDAQMGLLTGFAFAGVYAVFGIPIARWSDRGNRRLIIGTSVAVWSLAATLCGMAQSFAQLALSRAGVGVGEAGAIPPSQSLVADYFPPERRTSAIGILTSAATVAYIVVFTAGVALVDRYDWRTSFIILALPGFFIAALSLLGLSEPRQKSGRSVRHEPIKEAFLSLIRTPSYVFVVIAMTLYFVVAYGALTWFPAYMTRVLSWQLSDVGLTFALTKGLATLVGTLGGAYLTDRLGRNDQRWIARLPSLLLVGSFVFYMVSLASADQTMFFGASFIAATGIGAALPAMFSVLHLVCGGERRSMAVAIMFFFANFIGLGIGPLMTGLLSDEFTARYGVIGLRYALGVSMFAFIPSSIAMWICSRRLRCDLERMRIGAIKR
ncbi:spinster family MFS transporter [Tsuneonella rigui]|uniref:spinster family MFS transporter n=1 Tax=Tsuneonella rigui TaxID=1708790 RepID=UPI000F7EA179|nr:MFS transporter [Tsuneonella rigui]